MMGRNRLSIFFGFGQEVLGFHHQQMNAAQEQNQQAEDWPQGNQAQDEGEQPVNNPPVAFHMQGQN